jgi:hypothetical protein
VSIVKCLPTHTAATLEGLRRLAQLQAKKVGGVVLRSPGSTDSWYVVTPEKTYRFSAHLLGCEGAQGDWQVEKAYRAGAFLSTIATCHGWAREALERGGALK